MNLKQYINKTLFRTFFFLVFLFTGFTFITNGFTMQTTWVECDVNSILDCNNPHYCKIMCPEYCSKFDGICEIQTIAPGEIVGKKPNFALVYYDLIISVGFILLLLINHLLYKRKELKE